MILIFLLVYNYVYSSDFEIYFGKTFQRSGSDPADYQPSGDDIIPDSSPDHSTVVPTTVTGTTVKSVSTSSTSTTTTTTTTTEKVDCDSSSFYYEDSSSACIHCPLPLKWDSVNLHCGNSSYWIGNDESGYCTNCAVASICYCECESEYSQSDYVCIHNNLHCLQCKNSFIQTGKLTPSLTTLNQIV